jgi:transglutaminase-like putative cysteine protease
MMKRQARGRVKRVEAVAPGHALVGSSPRDVNLEAYLVPGEFVDSDDTDVRAFAQEVTAGVGDPVSRAVRLYYAIRDGIPYGPRGGAGWPGS